MIVPILASLAAVSVMVFGETLRKIYLSAMESLGVPAPALEFFGKFFPVLRWFFAPAALVLAVVSFFIR